MMEGTRLDSTDKELLKVVQDSFPLSLDPWAEIGKMVGVSGEEALARVRLLQQQKIIRRIGPIVESRRLGQEASTLILLRVPSDRIDDVARVVNEHECVTHNYERDCEYNVWFTLRAKDKNELDIMTNEIMSRTRMERTDILDLPTIKRFKIKVRFVIE